MNNTETEERSAADETQKLQGTAVMPTPTETAAYAIIAEPGQLGMEQTPRS